MGVYIKGMKKPEKCLDCPMRNYEDWCVLQEWTPEKNDYTWEDMRKNCPLIEVKEPHWRLIDADELLKDEWTWFDDFGNYSGEGQLIADAPVIIEATKEE